VRTQCGDGQLRIASVRYDNALPISLPDRSGSLQSDIALRIELGKELGPRGTALVSAKTSQGGCNPPGGFDAFFIYASRDFPAAAYDQSNSAIASGPGINRRTLMLWGRFRRKASQICGSLAPWQEQTNLRTRKDQNYRGCNPRPSRRELEGLGWMGTDV
jgi:hypothetical protein